MPRCPDCGAEVEEWASVCHNCEATLADGKRGRRHEETESDESPPNRGQQGRNAGRGGQGHSERNQGGRRRSGGQQRRTTRRRNRGDRADSDETDESEGGGGVSRRAVLAGGVGLAALAGGGFLGYRRFLTDSGGPKTTAREFLKALEENDTDTARSLIHPDRQDAFEPGGGESDSELSIHEAREVPDEYETGSRSDVTFVETDVTVTADGTEDDATFVLELHDASGDWKVWALWIEGRTRPPGSTTTTATPTPSGPRVPQVTFSFDWTESDDSAGTLTVSHDGGETVNAGTLVLQGSNPAADNLGETWDSYHSEMGPDDDVTAGDSITVDPVASDASALIVWESQESDASSALGEWDGPDA